ncbi:MAG: S-layer homology domain-containing protein [Clostridiaceae bacterium]|nr:S-layer homology domain-containing protein [Clostridiaceae bacterium]
MNRIPAYSASGKKLADFSDSKHVADWAKKATACLVDAGIINGSSGKLYPRSLTTRSEMAHMLFSLLNK